MNLTAIKHNGVSRIWEESSPEYAFQASTWSASAATPPPPARSIRGWRLRCVPYPWTDPSPSFACSIRRPPPPWAPYPWDDLLGLKSSRFRFVFTRAWVQVMRSIYLWRQMVPAHELDASCSETKTTGKNSVGLIRNPQQTETGGNSAGAIYRLERRLPSVSPQGFSASSVTGPAHYGLLQD